MLIGVSPQTLSVFVPEETRRGNEGEPAALKTPLGWVAFGPMKHADENSANVSNFARTQQTKVTQLENEDVDGDVEAVEEHENEIDET